MYSALISSTITIFNRGIKSNMLKKFLFLVVR